MDEVVNGAVTKTYAYGLQRISENQQISGAWTPSFYGYDGHGNVRYLTNAAGAITDTYTYDAFGLPITSTGTTPNAYTYSGERFDQNIGLFHLRARDYNPLTGRFETTDPAEGDILNPATLHKYVYAANNPVNASDPTGRLVFFGYTITLKQIIATALIAGFLAEDTIVLYECVGEGLKSLDSALSGPSVGPPLSNECWGNPHTPEREPPGAPPLGPPRQPDPRPGP